MSRTGFIQNELDLKLLVLYIMARAAAPITFLQLLDLALCDAGVDYFSLTEAVNHLVETEHLAQEGDLYSITDKGRRLKIYYMTQVGIKPPHFVCFCNDARLFHFSYQRYLENQIRSTFGLEGTPVRLTVRQKGEKEE